MPRPAAAPAPPTAPDAMAFVASPAEQAPTIVQRVRDDLREVLAGPYAGFEPDTAPQHGFVVPASPVVPLIVKVRDSPRRPASFVAAFTNPVGNVLGAYLAAMLYDTVAPALLATIGPDRFQSTLQMNVQFLRPVRPGRVTAHGRVVDVDGDTAELSATLHDDRGDLVTTATATAKIIPLDHARDAA